MKNQRIGNVQNLALLAVSIAMFASFGAFGQNVITFDDQGHADQAFLGNPYTILNNGETFVFTMFNGGSQSSGDHRYRTTDFEGCNYTGLNYLRNGGPSDSWNITTSSGNEIDLGTVTFVNVYGCPFYSFNYSITVEGFKDGVSTGTQTLTVNSSNTTFNPNSNFDAVDEIRITATTAVTGLGIDNVNWTLAAPSANSWDGSTSTDWNTASNWSNNAVPTSSDDVIIPSAPSNQPHVTLDPASPAVCNNITIDAGAALTVDAGKALTVSGTTDNDGTILIKADATGIGSFIDNGTIIGSGSFQMEQYLTGSGGATPNGVFYYVSSPIPNATAATYGVPASNKLWVDDEATQTYPQLTFGAIPLEVGQGYIARMGATGTTTFSGSSFNTGNITEGGLTRTGTSELNRGYNLVGNPYPSTVNWDDLSKTNLETTMWYRTNNGGTMTFDTYNSTGMVGTNNNGGGTVDGTIPPTQAFWVRVDADGNTGSVSFENADRSHGTLAGIYKVESEEGTVRLSLSNGTISDEQVIYFDASADDAIDDFDSRKFWATDIPQLYSNLNQDTLTINGLNSPQTTPSVPLGMKLPAQGNYSLDATNITLVSTPAILEDTYLNVFQDLDQNPNYSFISEAGNIGDRFILHFSNALVGVEEAEARSHVFATDGQLNISLAPNMENANLQVLDMAGRFISTRAINRPQTTMDMNVPTGVYLVRIETSKGVDTRKIVLQ